MKFRIGPEPKPADRPVRAELVMSRLGRPQLLLNGHKVLEISEEGLLNKYLIGPELKSLGIKANREGWIKEYGNDL